MYNRTLALKSTTEATVKRKAYNVIDQLIIIQWATASLVQAVANNQRCPGQ